jgi:hypothetical protein
VQGIPVQRLRNSVRDGRSVPLPGQPTLRRDTVQANQELVNLALALRAPMRKAGAYSNPDPALGQRTDEWDDAEADYCRITGHRGRPPAASKFELHGREYLFDSVWPVLKRELELNRPVKQRTPAALSLAQVLHARELSTGHVLAARTKLEEIYRSLRPVDQPDPVHLLPLRVVGRAA